MDFYVNTMCDNGSGLEYFTKEDFMEEISLMIDDCIANGGTYFGISVDTDASCFNIDEDEEEENEDMD